MTAALQGASPSSLSTRAATVRRSEQIAPSCRGLNFFEIDHSMRSRLPIYMENALANHLEPHFSKLGELGGGRLGALSDAAEHHIPQLHQRDAYGRDEEWVEFHPAYREMETIAFGQFGMHAMSHRGSVLG